MCGGGQHIEGGLFLEGRWSPGGVERTLGPLASIPALADCSSDGTHLFWASVSHFTKEELSLPSPPLSGEEDTFQVQVGKMPCPISIARVDDQMTCLDGTPRVVFIPLVKCWPSLFLGAVIGTERLWDKEPVWALDPAGLHSDPALPKTCCVAPGGFLAFSFLKPGHDRIARGPWCQVCGKHLAVDSLMSSS